MKNDTLMFDKYHPERGARLVFYVCVSGIQVTLGENCHPIDNEIPAESPIL